MTELSFVARGSFKQTHVNTRQHPSPRVDCMQTSPFSLHLSKHVALFRRSVSRGPAACFRTPGNQPSEVFLQPQNVTFSFPQGVAFRAVAFISTSFESELIIAALVERTKRESLFFQSFMRRLDLLVLLICCWFKPAALLAEVQEFQLFPTLFCKSYYPPLISCRVRYIVQTVSDHFSVIALQEELSFKRKQDMQTAVLLFLISSQKMQTT